VTLALRALAEKGLIYYQAYTSPTLTNEGHTLAANVRYRHNILQHFLGDILQVSEERAEQNACRIEHAIDRTTLARLAQFLGFLKSHPVILGEWLPKDEQADRGSGGSALRKKGTDECR
jgi:DtxR family Mn-dependent transcriptional regulator